jgi:anti-sigma B factor antagonist
MSDQHIGVEDRGSAVVVSPEGDIDMSRSPEFRSALRDVNDGKPATLVVNLEKVGYMDSSGLATLVECMRTAKGNRTEMILCGMNERVRAIFEIARLDQFFRIEPTLDDIESL